MPQHYSDPSRASDPHALPNIETFFQDWDGDLTIDDEQAEIGWYYWFCFPGCMPDGEPMGPFETEEEALEDARAE